MSKLMHSHGNQWSDEYPRDRAHAHLEAAHGIASRITAPLSELRDRHEAAHRDGEFIGVGENVDIPQAAIGDMPPELDDDVSGKFAQYTLEQRKQLVSQIPWVARFPGAIARSCQALVDAPGWAHSIDARDHDGVLRGRPNVDELVLLNKYRCERRGRFLYIQLDGRTRAYCFSHTTHRLTQYSMAEAERYEKWADDMDTGKFLSWGRTL